ncbi:hypothetical protein M917_1016 [Psychrobacter aquaticus CMS 56]|uniref:Uncharacterized protein n=1 Tax=Psychrobacter aquaticus CMS 56 TaxID=1354303 RepID=U4TCZ0_9GAMM|nr:hypothetical protein M917_1016 [Psychrobacter aquaticus CMS 56]
MFEQLSKFIVILLQKRCAVSVGYMLTIQAIYYKNGTNVYGQRQVITYIMQDILAINYSFKKF